MGSDFWIALLGVDRWRPSAASTVVAIEQPHHLSRLGEPMTSGAEFSWEAPSEHGRHWIEIELYHLVNPWEHEVVGSIT